MSPAPVSYVAHRLDRTLRKTAIAAVACTGLMLAASQTHAVPVYSGVVNVTLPATTAGIYINVVTGVIGVTPAAVTGWDLNLWSSTGIGFFSPTTPTGGAYVVTAGVADNMAAGTLIGAVSTFGTGTSLTFSQWNLNSSNNLFGFRFLNEADGLVHYGWGRLAFGATISTRTLVGYAYESLPGVPVAAGAVGPVPEPATFGLMAVGIAGLLLARRRQQS